MKFLKRLIAVIALTSIYTLAGLISKLRFLRGPRRAGPILLIGTFHNPNWVWAHVEPIARCEAAEVYLVADEPIEGIPNVNNVCAPRWLQKSITRAGAKFVWSLYIALKIRPSVCMGYHVFPAGVIALIAATISGARASFQVTAGELELEGGGWHAENALLVALQRESILAERAVHFMTRQFDLLVVRGNRAKDYCRKLGYKNAIELVTGSVVYPEEIPQERDIDMLFIGRLAEYKRPDRLLEVLSKVTTERPETNLVMIGEGPDLQALENQAAELGISENVSFLGQRSDVEQFQARSKTNVLTSRWEGVSIAMLEAMAWGVVPVVSDVGDLRDFVTPETGALLHENDIDGFATAILSLLNNHNLWKEKSAQCRTMIRDRSSKQAVCARWQHIFKELSTQDRDYSTSNSDSTSHGVK